MVEVEEMGMTDRQWKSQLRHVLSDITELEELVEEDDKEKAMKKIERIKHWLQESIES